MQLAIISDTHDNLANLERFFGAIKSKEIVGLIHCGDVTNLETLNYILAQFNKLDEEVARGGPFGSSRQTQGKPIKLVCGNAEINREEFFSLAKQVEDLEVFEELGEWAIDGRKLAFIHKPDQPGELAKSGQYDFVFHGHTHQPWIEQIGSTLIANPGALTGGAVAPTFAILDTVTGRLELKRL